MTIITNLRCHRGYPLTAVAPDLAQVISTALRPGKVSQLLLRLECYLQITGKTLDLPGLQSASGRKDLSGFTAALFSESFHKVDRPWQIARFLKIAIGEACPPYPTTKNRISWPETFSEEVAQFESAELDEERVCFWKGWTSTNLKGDGVSLVLWPLYERYGREMCRSYFAAVDAYFRARRNEQCPGVNEFSEFLRDYPHTIDFSSSRDVGVLFRGFFDHYFQQRRKAGVSLSGTSNCWREFRLFAEGHLTGHIWATALPAIPAPKIVLTPGESTHVRTAASGLQHRVSLLTTIPLHISDSAAKELLFGRIRSDVDVVMRWARAEIEEARGRLKQRNEWAKKGTASDVGATGVNTGKRARLDRESPDRLMHAAASLEQLGYTPEGEVARLLYPYPLGQTAWDLALATPQLLLAHASLLVAKYPIITTTFLEELDLYDSNGDRTGFVEIDGRWYLIGKKMRKGPAKAQQRVLLDVEAADVVRDLVELSKPLRTHLREKGDDRWRKLILSTPSMGAMPSTWNASQQAFRHREWIAQRMVVLAGVGEQVAREVCEQFSLKRLRSSAAVLIYIETGSVERMAKALGHSKWSPKLLNHYLPPFIQEFFVERWLRIFQAGFICEAMKDSRFLLEAAGFDSMDALDSFLEHHALRIIPAHLVEPEPASSKDANSPTNQVAFGIELGVLTVLASIMDAVRVASKLPCGRAIYWAKVGERLFAHLAAQKEQPEFRSMAEEALRCTNPSKVEDLLYG